MPISLRQAFLFLMQAGITCSTCSLVLSQQPRTPEFPAPPPMRFVSRSERSELSASKDAKARVRATIRLAEERLARAEKLTAAKSFNPAAEELGAYLGLIEDLQAFLRTFNTEKGSTRDLYRYMEMAVRPHIPRLAVMRRTTPASYAVNIKDAEEYIKDVRSAALETFFGHSVLRSDVPVDRPAEQSKEPPTPIKRP